ncbi:hypothetical protein ACFOD1_04390 [Pseudidiomarina halophila]|uniref:Uncharacterized protein n=1 Tax=Pseudidiomarina halophila TaxID=1449799 RepID=A0A432XZM9_9GAMM|nr:hypothetical protein [Pseudidiomarina halophila]RUO54170.1 hypothetical protein CWI69_01740 [Pseudidiomarina halophila]
MNKLTHLLYLSVIAFLAIALWQQATTPMPADSLTSANTENMKVPNRADIQAPAAQPIPSAESGETVSGETQSATLTSADNEANENAESNVNNSAEIDETLEQLRGKLSTEQLDDLIRRHLLVDGLEERMQSEAIDQDWAYFMQESITHVYEDNEQLQTAVLNSIECRTTICVVEFSGLDTPMDYMSNFHAAMVQSSWFSTDYRTAMISNPGDNTHRIQIFRP